jgi:hypothetical protein
MLLQAHEGLWKYQCLSARAELCICQEARAAVAHHILPALAAERQGAYEAAASDFPLGFSTGGDNP